IGRLAQIALNGGRRKIGRARPGASFRKGSVILETQRTNSGTAFHGGSGGLRRVGDRSARGRRGGRPFEAKGDKKGLGRSDFGEWAGEVVSREPPAQTAVVTACGRAI